MSTSPMQATFRHENPFTAYDSAIKSTRHKMSSVNPCEAVKEINSLLSKLQEMRGSYEALPCGKWCTSVRLWHTARIGARVKVLSQEAKTVHIPACDAYRRSTQIRFVGPYDKGLSFHLKQSF